MKTTSLHATTLGNANNFTVSPDLFPSSDAHTDGHQTSSGKAKLVSASPSSLSHCADRLRQGRLVAFPTETVYGLGCHALDAQAVQLVFQAKERPPTDPLIVHLFSNEHAFPLWDAFASPSHTQIERDLLTSITNRFWPGPLTLVAKASPLVPPAVTSGTGFVGCRVPSHPLARALLQVADLPIAAPSANKFGHVSPTKPQHVFNDLADEDVWIIDPSLPTPHQLTQTPPPTTQQSLVCQVGVESTVAKLERISPHQTTPQLRLTLLRHGAISAQDLTDSISDAGLQQFVQVLESTNTATKTDVTHVAPGQTIRHYAPNVHATYIIAQHRWTKLNHQPPTDLPHDEYRLLQRAVIIDFGAKLLNWKSIALAYTDLSPTADSTEAAAAVFETLRWSETLGADRVYFPELLLTPSQSTDALLLALKDRLTRAASGVVIHTLQ